MVSLNFFAHICKISPFHFVATFALLCILIPESVLASDFVPMVGIPGVDDSSNFDQYLQSLYGLSISIAALLAVIKIIIAGVKYMLTDVVTSKGDAKKDIQAALIGLIVVVAAVLILTIINPQLVNFNIFGAPTIDDVGVAGADDDVITAAAVLVSCPSGPDDACDCSTVTCPTGTIYGPVSESLCSRACIPSDTTVEQQTERRIPLADITIADYCTISGPGLCASWDRVALTNDYCEPLPLGGYDSIQATGDPFAEGGELVIICRRN